MDLEKIKLELRRFTKERDWEQFHDPKNLSMALSVEVAELVEIFQWSKSGGLDEIKDPETKEAIQKEIADIFNYLLKLVDLMDIDLEKVALEKIQENAKKYPIEKFKGISKKYNI
jgi:NTP pyrophosphatase (non-canonical NTP hydrolase)